MFGFGFGFGREAPPPVGGGGGPSFPSGALAIWDFEDTLVSSPGSYTLTASGGNSYVTGKINTKALQLTEGNYARVTTDDFNFNANPFTCSFWSKFSSGGQLFVGYVGGGISWKATVIGTEVDFDGADGNYGTLADTPTLAADTYAFVCIRSDGTTWSLNVNARTKQTLTAGALSDLSGNYLELSAVLGTCAFDQVAIDDRCWTDQEVADAYNGGSGVSS